MSKNLRGLAVADDFSYMDGTYIAAKGADAATDADKSRADTCDWEIQFVVSEDQEVGVYVSSSRTNS